MVRRILFAQGFNPARRFYREMRLLQTIILLVLWAVGSTPLSLGAEAVPVAPAGVPAALAAGPDAAAEEGGHEGGHHGLPNAAPFLGKEGGLPITNSMFMTWAVALLLIVFARRATKRIQEVPSGAQNFWEWLVESLYEFLEGIIGKDLVKKTFWFFATIFILILFVNWAGLIPGVGTIGWGQDTGHGFFVERPLLRGGNADMNLTLAMAMVFFGCWIVWAFQANGATGFFLHIFGPKGETTGVLKILMIFVFVAVGLLEVISILFRPVSLSFRLYGNIFAGENMVETMIGMAPILRWITPIPFYFLEVLVGLVQALVFMLLTAVFTMLICMHDEDHESAHH